MTKTNLDLAEKKQAGTLKNRVGETCLRLVKKQENFIGLMLKPSLN